MDIDALVWSAASVLAGLVIGYLMGQLIRTVFVFWQDAATALRHTKSILLWCIGSLAPGGVFARWSSSMDAGLYFLCLFAGLILGYLTPIPQNKQRAREEELLKSYRANQRLVEETVDDEDTSDDTEDVVSRALTTPLGTHGRELQEALDDLEFLDPGDEDT